MSVRTKWCFLGLNQTKETVTWSSERTHGSKWARISAQPHVFKEHKRKKTKNKENVSPCCFKQSLVNLNSLNNPSVCLLLLFFFFTTPGSLKMFWLLHFQSFSEEFEASFQWWQDWIGIWSIYWKERFWFSYDSVVVSDLLNENRLSKSDGKKEMLIKNQSLKHRDDFLTSCFCLSK